MALDISDSKYIAVIPARFGSKGVERKNFRKVGSATLVERAIGSAIDSRLFSQVIVSTDWDLFHTSESKVKVHQRSAKSASDEATASDVIWDLHNAISFQDETYIVYLQPTSPFRTSEHSAAVDFLESNGAKCLVSVGVVTQHPEKMLEVKFGELEPFMGATGLGSNRQDFPIRYYPNGSIFIFQFSEFVRQSRIPIFGALPFVQEGFVNLDIDSEIDLKVAEGLALAYGI